ncbi:hypothetical protein X943_003566 [Babesia divergens]|uniref:Uncharacterized protein n=1 Tax=Babesia divergens TaxID=32595 RepID=A0AAD9LI90_BABDI|nr:hypothetical protein X943_003566 [Babesia divergens]
MKTDRCVKGISKPADKAPVFGTDAAKLSSSSNGEALKSKSQNRRMKDNRKILEELQQEAKELLSLTYGLSMDGPKPIASKPILDTPKLNLDADTADAINAKWQEEFPPRSCKLLPRPGVTKSCVTEKALNANIDNGTEGTSINLNSTDVVSPIPHLEKPISYPLDLSINDFSRSAPLVTNATRESYREMLVALQQKYTVILRMFEEINEQRMSYMEGIQELQGHMDNARSVMQLQKAEITKLRGHIEMCESVIQTSEADLKQANVLISDKIHHEAILENELRDKQECIDSMTAEMSTMQSTIANLTQQLSDMSFMPKLVGNSAFQNVRYTYEDALKELDELIKTLEDTAMSEEELNQLVAKKAQETGALRYLETLSTFPITARLVAFYRQRFVIAEKFKHDLLMIRESNEKEIERNYEITQQLVNTYAARVHQANADSLSVRTLLNHIARRATCNLVNVDPHSKMSERITKQLRIPIHVKFFDKPFMGKPCFRDNSLRVLDEVVQIGRIRGSSFIPKHSFPVSDIHKVEFGFMSSCYILHQDAVKGLDVKPWQFFTISTHRQEYHMLCTTDTLLDVVVIGLNRMIVHHRFMVNVIDISRMRLLRAKMRLHHYCAKNNITHCRMWLEAVKKTIAERAKSPQ